MVLTLDMLLGYWIQNVAMEYLCIKFISSIGWSMLLSLHFVHNSLHGVYAGYAKSRAFVWWNPRQHHLDQPREALKYQICKTPHALSSIIHRMHIEGLLNPSTTKRTDDCVKVPHQSTKEHIIYNDFAMTKYNCLGVNFANTDQLWSY